MPGDVVEVQSWVQFLLLVECPGLQVLVVTDTVSTPSFESPWRVRRPRLWKVPQLLEKKKKKKSLMQALVRNTHTYLKWEGFAHPARQ